MVKGPVIRAFFIEEPFICRYALLVNGRLGIVGRKTATPTEFLLKNLV
jgi:hypothetical protein